MAEKDGYMVGGESPVYADAANVVRERGKSIGEAADIYGNIETAEEYGYVTRGSVFAFLSF